MPGRVEPSQHGNQASFSSTVTTGRRLQLQDPAGEVTVQKLDAGQADPVGPSVAVNGKFSRKNHERAFESLSKCKVHPVAGAAEEASCVEGSLPGVAHAPIGPACHGPQRGPSSAAWRPLDRASWVSSARMALLASGLYVEPDGTMEPS